MKKQILISVCLFCFYAVSFSQRISIAADEENLLYVGIDNPITVAIENLSCKSIVVKTDNGEIKGNDGSYDWNPRFIGMANITIYKKVNKDLKVIGKRSFRAKQILNPFFKIGPYSTNDSAEKRVIEAQEYVRCEFGNFGIDANFQIDSFTVCIYSADSCKYGEISNIGNKVNDEIKKAFSNLKKDDFVIFKRIYAKQFDGTNAVLSPCILYIIN